MSAWERAAQMYFDPPSPVPTCDICDEPESFEWGEEDDWNGEMGNHLSCEERRSQDDVMSIIEERLLEHVMYGDQ